MSKTESKILSPYEFVTDFVSKVGNFNAPWLNIMAEYARYVRGIVIDECALLAAEIDRQDYIEKFGNII